MPADRAASLPPLVASHAAAGNTSLMQETPPEPPSPYRPKIQKPAASVLPSLFTTKLDTLRRRDPSGRRLREAAAAAEAELKKTQHPAKRTLGKDRRRSSSNTPAAAAAPRAAPGKDTAAIDAAILEHHFLEAQRGQVLTDEANARIEMHTEQELAYTRSTLGHLESLALAITASELSEAELERADQVIGQGSQELRAAKEQRGAERRALLERIAATTSERLRGVRAAKMMETQFARLFPAHREGALAVMAAEQLALVPVLEREHSTRPLGAGCVAMAIAADLRFRGYERRKKSRYHKPTITETTIERLRSARDVNVSATADPSHGALVLYGNEDAVIEMDPPDTTPEFVFERDGKETYIMDKAARYEALRRARAVEDLCIEEEAARSDILLAESEAYMPVIVTGVDGFYSARQAAHAREADAAAFAASGYGDRAAWIDATYRLLSKEHAELKETDGAGTAINSLAIPCSGDPVQPAAEAPGRVTLTLDDQASSPDRCQTRSELFADTVNAIPAADASVRRCSQFIGAHSEGDLDLASLIVHPNDMCSFVDTGSPNSTTNTASPVTLQSGRDALSILARNGNWEEADLRAALLSQLDDAKAGLVSFLRNELWAHDLLIPEATAALLASHSALQVESARLLMEMAGSRTGIVNEQIDALVDLWFADDSSS